jgi:hypothetical protein
VTGAPGSEHNGDFGEAPGSPVQVGKWPVAVAVGDFNGDGLADLAVADRAEPTVTILLGDGKGGFRPAANSPVQIPATPQETAAHNLGRPTALVVGDFNGDGHADLAVAVSGTRPENVTILLGDGRGNFTPAPTSPHPVQADPNALTQPESVAVADLNHDGHLDLATANAYGNDVTVLLGKGNGDFAQAVGSPVDVRTQRSHQAAVSSVAVGDFNGDGNPDLVTADTYENHVSVLLGDGTGSFTEAPNSPFNTGNGPNSVAVADLNGDGHPDLVTANYYGGDLTVLLGDGTGGFTPAPGGPVVTGVPGADPESVVVGDFNGDDHPDLAVAESTPDGGRVSILLGDGTGGFSPAATSPLKMAGSPGANSLAVGDFNSDHRDDLAVAVADVGNSNGNGSSTGVTILLQR